MTTEENKALVRRLIEEVITKGNLHLADDLLAHDFTLYSTTMGSRVERHGPGTFVEAIRSLRAAWAEVQARPLYLIAEGDHVACWVEIRGSHHQGAGTWRGIPATGKDATWTGVRLFRVVDGRIAELRAIEDEVGLLTQLGVAYTAPEPQQGRWCGE